MHIDTYMYFIIQILFHQIQNVHVNGMIQLIIFFYLGNHGHIITGNLNIVSNLKLRKLMGYDTKFKLPSCVSVK